MAHRQKFLLTAELLAPLQTVATNGLGNAIAAQTVVLPHVATTRGAIASVITVPTRNVIQSYLKKRTHHQAPEKEGVENIHQIQVQLLVAVQMGQAPALIYLKTSHKLHLIHLVIIVHGIQRYPGKILNKIVARME